MARVALVSALAARGRDDDLIPLTDALRDRGVTVESVDWDDPDVDWSSHDVAVIRSTWDYTERIDEFLAWSTEVSSRTHLHNPERLIRWNADKRYLADLIALDVPVVPTRYLAPGEAVDVAGILAAELAGGGEVVVKPTISAGSRDTARYRIGDLGAATAHAERLRDSGRTVMLQPYQGSVDVEGETALIYFGGVFSHAIRKAALLDPEAGPSSALFAPETITPFAPDDEHLATATEVLRALTRVPALVGVDLPPLYARIDLLRADDASLVVL